MSRIGVVVFPGSNCEYDAAAAVERLGDQAEFIWHTRTDLDGIDGVILPGASPTATTCAPERSRAFRR